MHDAAELNAVLARSEAMRWVEELADHRGCDVAVFDGRGAALVRAAALDEVLLVERSGDFVVEGAGHPAAVSAIDVYDRALGYVVAVARNGDDGSPPGVAERAAGVLGEFCTREYELNDMSREILSAYEELNLFYDLAGELASAADPTAICAAVLGRAASVMRVAAGRILLEQDGRLVQVAVRGPSPAVAAPADGAAARVWRSRQAELLEGRAQLDATDLDPWEATAREALITVPVYMQSDADRPAAGVLQLRDRTAMARDAAEAFRAGDLKLAQALAGQAAVLIQNSRLIGFERELLIARGIQESLLPQAAPDVPGLDVAGACIAAKNVGGDYYDFVVREDGSLACVLADVSGHHLAAALIQTSARSAFRASMRDQQSPAAVLAHVNAVLLDDLTRAELFLTSWHAVVDGRTGRLSYSDAGHHPALVFRAAEERVESLRMGGLPIGVADDGMYRDHEFTLAPGDVLVAYTDGVSEARGPGGPEDQFGDERVRQALARCAHRSADRIVAAVLDAVREFAARSDDDDRTLIVLKRRRPRAR